jgi:hypothetical protein
VPSFEYELSRRLERKALAGIDDVVDRVAAPGDPDTSFEHRERPADPVDPQRCTAVEAEVGSGVCEKLRFHHQSPGSR